MKKLTLGNLWLASLAVFLIYGQAFSQGTADNLRVGDNGRHFVNQSGRAFLINGDTGWQLLVNLNMDEIEDYLDNRKAKKFNTIQILLTGFEANNTNRAGVKPFANPNDFNTRNEAYFDFVEDVLDAARDRDMAVILAAAWQGAGDNVNWKQALQANGTARSRAFGNYLGTRFNRSRHPNLLAWLMGGDHELDYTYPFYKALAEGIREEDSNVFVTYHLYPGTASTDEVEDDWLNFNATYTYDNVYAVSYRAYELSPVIPFYLSEAVYEGPAANNSQDNASAERVRKQAYWSILSGSAGHVYGSKLILFPSNWRDFLNLPGATDLSYLHTFFEGFE